MGSKAVSEWSHSVNQPQQKKLWYKALKTSPTAGLGPSNPTKSAHMGEVTPQKEVMEYLLSKEARALSSPTDPGH